MACTYVFMHICMQTWRLEMSRVLVNQRLVSENGLSISAAIATALARLDSVLCAGIS